MDGDKGMAALKSVAHIWLIGSPAGAGRQKRPARAAACRRQPDSSPAELVAFGVSQHDPVGAAQLFPGHEGVQAAQPGQLGPLIAGARPGPGEALLLTWLGFGTVVKYSRGRPVTAGPVLDPGTGWHGTGSYAGKGGHQASRHARKRHPD